MARGTPLAYEIAAAAEVRVSVRPEELVSEQVDHRYGELHLVDVVVGSDTARVDFVLKVPDARKYTGFCVKLTAIFVKYPFSLYLAGPVEVRSDSELAFSALIVSLAGGFEGTMEYAFQLEVSRWQEE